MDLLIPEESRRKRRTLVDYVKNGAGYGAVLTGASALFLGALYSYSQDLGLLYQEINQVIPPDADSQFWINTINAGIAGIAGSAAGAAAGSGIGAAAYGVHKKIARPVYRSLEKIIKGD